jgi:hypothetical protein
LKVHVADADESNAAQWSTVYLSIPDPLEPTQMRTIAGHVRDVVN